MITFHSKLAADNAKLSATILGLTAQSRAALLAKVGYLLKAEAQAGARYRHGVAKFASSKGGGFWDSIARSVSYRSWTDSAVIGASHEAAAHKQFGGTIKAPGSGPGATGAKFLTIPISPMSRGYRVGELATKYRIFKLGPHGPAQDGSILATVKAVNTGGMGKAWLAEARKMKFLHAAGKTATGHQRYGNLIPLYVLKKSVTQKAEPWFPDEAAAEKALDRAADLLTK